LFPILRAAPAAATIAIVLFALVLVRGVQAQQTTASTAKQLERIGTDLFTEGLRVKESITELKAILGREPQSADAHFLLGVAYARLGAPDLMGEATAELRQALALNPALLQARYYLARLYLDAARPARARQELETALTQAPGHPQFLALLAETERLAGNPKLAVDLSRKVLAADPSMLEARYYLALALLALQQRDEAIRELELVVKSGAGRPEVYGALGAALLDGGRVDAAIAALQRAAKLDPARAETRVRLARAYREKGLLVRAEAELSRAAPSAIATQTSSAQLDLEADLRIERALLRLRQARVDDAIAELKAVIDRSPDRGPAHRAIAQAYLQKGSHALARDHAAIASKLGHPVPEGVRLAIERKIP
jgi:predicted Zn-dependent protease